MALRSLLSPPAAGDVVIARSVQNPRHVVCKRVLGLEGDTVNIPSSSKWGLGRTVTVGMH